MPEDNGRQYDPHLIETFKKIVQKFGIKSYIETGFRDAYNIERLSEANKSLQCYGADIDKQKYDWAKRYFLDHQFDHVTLFNIDSTYMIKVLGQWCVKQPVLFFLDANCDNVKLTPLKKELDAILEYFQQFVICIHDFEHPARKVPFNNQLEDIEEHVKWMDNPIIKYNTAAQYGKWDMFVGACFVWSGIKDNGFQPN